MMLAGDADFKHLVSYTALVCMSSPSDMISDCTSSSVRGMRPAVSAFNTPESPAEKEREHTLRVLCRDFRAQVYIKWVHGPLGIVPKGLLDDVRKHPTTN